MQITSPKAERHVHWNEATTVILVPERKEYEEAGLASELWTTQKEYKAFQQDASRELKANNGVEKYFSDHAKVLEIRKQFIDSQGVISILNRCVRWEKLFFGTPKWSRFAIEVFLSIRNTFNPLR
jgi:hypothetical protein